MSTIQMKMGHFCWLLLVMITLAYSCTEDSGDSTCMDGQDNSGPIEIRLKNVSDYDFTDVEVDTNGGQHSYCDLKSGAKSGYKKFASAYRYAFVELQISGKTYTIQPIDFVGETLLDKGKYTYEIDATDEDTRYGRLSIGLKVD